MPEVSSQNYNSLPSPQFLTPLTSEDKELPIPNFREIMIQYKKPDFAMFRKKKKYPEDKIDSDEEKLKDMLKKFGDKAREADTALEVCLLHGAIEEEWFGGNVVPTRSHEFDDVFRQTDCILSFPVFDEDDNVKFYASLGIDATTSSDPTTIENKNDKILNRLSKSNIGSVEYGYIFDEIYKKRYLGKIDLPQVVINIPHETVIQLQKIFVKKTRTPSEEQFVESIGNFVFLDVVRQLIVQAAFLLKEKLNINIKDKNFGNMQKIGNNTLTALKEINNFLKDEKNNPSLNPETKKHEQQRAAKNLILYKHLLNEFEQAAQMKF